MALIAFASAKGSPGVSVTVAGLAQLWPRRVVVADLDPAGGDTGLRYRADNGDPLNPSTGLLSLGAAVRSGQTAALEDHLQTTAGGMHTLVGVNAPGQVLGLGPAWQHIALTLRHSSEYDVLADCGRLTPGSPAMAIIDQADAVVMISRGELEDVAHLRERLRGLQSSLHLGSIDATPTGIAMVTAANDTRGLSDAEQLLASAGLPVRALGIIAEDRKAADALRTESGRNIRRSVLVRSLHDLTGRLHDLTTLTGRVRQPVR
jgi:MinD-like ATPase involved in chromosome partitioning or flagellar assembly